MTHLFCILRLLNQIFTNSPQCHAAPQLPMRSTAEDSNQYHIHCDYIKLLILVIGSIIGINNNKNKNRNNVFQSLKYIILVRNNNLSCPNMLPLQRASKGCLGKSKQEKFPNIHNWLLVIVISGTSVIRYKIVHTYGCDLLKYNISYCSCIVKLVLKRWLNCDINAPNQHTGGEIYYEAGT